MITGYNTDVVHDGVVYHVQTEDKGLQTPMILSLVYTGGEILASKRSPYEDLIASGFDEKILSERLQRQHKLICAAINAGRIEDLKKMGAPYAAGAQPAPPRVADSAVPADAASETEAAEAERFAISGESAEGLTVSLFAEKQMRAGDSVTLRVQVMKGPEGKQRPAAKAEITVKVLGSAFQSSATYSTTDSAGCSAISITLPTFKGGRAALLIRAEANGEVAEIRRIIHPA